MLFGKLQKGGVVKVSVEEKPDGDDGAEARIHPRRERAAQGASAAPLERGRRAEAEDPAAESAEGRRPKGSEPKGGGSVPRVPLKA